LGYYLKITKSNLGQSSGRITSAADRGERRAFITPELKEMEGKILGAEERSVKLNTNCSSACMKKVLASTKIQQTASALAQLDVLAFICRDSATP